jgi:hypothetical protein
MYEVAERFYMELIPAAREIAADAAAHGHAQAATAQAAIDAVLARPEHAWFEHGAEEQSETVRRGMRERYGKEAQ